ncbi:MAG: amphi-Trp domain-containing protein [Alphaproteobacteria bacterium]|nr:amphi-Trp domain-containing protein [Rhodospirillales bacterium]MCW9045342.1 amphi-Trp domain-containing protein [Alphaproteobacteria bacterium]
MKHNTKFRHESLQDRDSIKRLLRALTSGIAKGKITLEDEDGAMTMEPNQLVNFKITASQDEDKSSLNFRLTWTNDWQPEKDKSIKIKSG